VIGEPHGPSDRTCTAGILRDIVSGKPYQIHLETPPNHTSCDIDAAGVETACAAVINDVLASDLVVLSKFRKLEAVQQGLAAKELIHEEFGDGIMSAIDFSMDVSREVDPKGDRVKVTMSGKFLPYKTY
jgi:Cyanate lyase C-terminal domain/Protein of unknown function (DUF2478)